MKTTWAYVAEFEMRMCVTPQAMAELFEVDATASGSFVTLSLPNPYGATLATLRERVRYGGRKGRAAARRLASGRFNASGKWMLKDVSWRKPGPHEITVVEP